MPDTDAARARLEAQLAEFESRLARIAADLAEPLAADSSEQAVETEDDAALEAQAALITGEIASARRALERIAEGTYGECAQCGGEIAQGRLEARPEAALCIECATRSE